MDVAQAAHLTVDEVFALAGPVEAAGDLDIARKRADDLVKRRVATVAVPVAIASRVPVTVARRIGGVELGQRRNLRRPSLQAGLLAGRPDSRQSRKTQPHFR